MMGTGSFSTALSVALRDVDHSLPSSAEVKKEYELYFLSPPKRHHTV